MSLDAERVATHWHECWRTHYECARAEIARLEERIALIRAHHLGTPR